MRKRHLEERDGERGQVLVLTLGAAALAATLIAVIATASAVYLDRKELLGLADAAAAHAASQIDTASYYEQGEIAVTDPSVRAAAADFLAQAPPSLTDAPGLHLADPTGSPDGATAQVTLAALSRPSFLPWVLAPWSNGIAIEVTASARGGG